MTIKLEVSDSLPATVVALLREDHKLGDEIRKEYNALINLPPTAQGRAEIREGIDRMKEERDLVSARLIGWWRAALIQNGIDWETADDATH